MARSLFFAALSIAAIGCSRPKDGVTLAPPPAPSTSLSVSAEPAPSSSAPPPALVGDQNLAPKEGHGSFTGMVRPTKGGYEVRGVVFDDAAFRKQMDASLDGIPSDREWFLGAKVKVTATLAAAAAPPPPKKGEIVQQRSGASFTVKTLESVELLQNAKTLDGTLARSKGFFALKAHLVTQEDIAWSVPGAKEGDHVKLRGQTRIVTCEPNAQCLMEGSLPLFDVGRGERVP